MKTFTRHFVKEAVCAVYSSHALFRGKQYLEEKCTDKKRNNA